MGGVLTPINKDESSFKGTNPLIYGEVQQVQTRNIDKCMYLNVGEDISDTMRVGGVLTPINKDESSFKGTNPLLYGEVQQVQTRNID